MIRSYDKPIDIELRFRPVWLEIGLKAQKLIAQGNTLGLGVNANNRPARAKALFTAINALLPLQGVPSSDIYKPRVTLRSALGYVLVALSGRPYQLYRSFYFMARTFGPLTPHYNSLL